MARISVIGAGNMGGAFAEALSKRKDISLCIYDSCRPCAEKIAGTKANVTVLDSMDQARGSDVVVIAVKPQVLPQIYDQLSALKPGFFISIAAGSFFFISLIVSPTALSLISPYTLAMA